MDEHLYVVTYDIRDPRRWRRIFRIMKGYGEWVQLSVFQCRLNRQRHAELIALGVKIKSAPANFEDVRICFFFDPDGNSLELVEDPRGNGK